MNVKIYSLLFFLALSQAVYANNIDSLIVLLNKANEPDKIDIFIQLSKAYWSISPSKGVFYANEAIKLTEKYQEPNNKAKALLYGGVNNWFIGDYNNAIDYYQKSLTIARKINDKRLCAYNLNNLGMVHTYLKNYKAAIENYTESSHVIEELGDKIEFAKIQNNIAELNMFMGNLDTALKLHLLVLNIIEKSDEQVFLIWLYNNIGTVYEKLENSVLALQYFDKALKLSYETNNTLGKSQTMNRIGKVYLSSKRYDEANEIFFNALKYAIDASSKEIINDSYRNISEYYAAIENYQKSLEYYMLFKQLSDSILNENKIRTIIEMQARFDLESVENENSLLQKNIEINKLTIKKNTTQRRYLIISLILTFALIALIYSQLRIKKNRNQELKEKNTLINNQKEQLTETLHQQQKLNDELQRQKVEIQLQTKELKATNEKLVELDQFKEGMTGMIVHDLKNPLNQILQATNLDRVKQSGKQMLNLVMNILDVQKFEDAKMILDYQNCSPYNIVQSAYKQVFILIEEKNITFENKIDPNLRIKTEFEILERVFVNLFTNAIKFTPNNGKITVCGELQANSERQENSSHIPLLLIKVSDTGQGIPSENLPNVFEKFVQVKTIKSGSIRSTGLGLTFCKLAIHAHGGQIGADSKIGEGTTLWFTIPLATEFYNSTFAETQQPQAETFILLRENRQILYPLLTQFKEFEVYEISSIRQLLSNIDVNNNQNLRHWTQELQNALRAGNEEKYVKLLKLIDNA